MARLATCAAFKGLRPDYHLTQTITTHRSPVCGVYGAARAPCSCARAADPVPDGSTKARQPAVVSAGRMGGWLIGDGQGFKVLGIVSFMHCVICGWRFRGINAEQM